MSSKDSLIQSLISEGYLKTPRIIEAFKTIDRANFVLTDYQDDAYANHPLPIGEGQTISQPLTVAFMLELLDPERGEKILEIGSGSGWTTALLAYVVSNSQTDTLVYAIERIPEVCAFGEENIKKYNFIEKGIVRVFCQDGTKGLPEYAPFDKILAGAAASKDIPHEWRMQLKIRGKIVAPVGNSIWLFTKKSEREWEEKEFRGFAFVPLINDTP